MRRSASTVVAAAALAVGGLVANPAYAISAGYSPEGVCGSGFGRVSDGSRAVKTSSGRVFGHVYLLYNRSTKQNCVVTIKSAYVGTATRTSATLETQTRRHRDEPVRTARKTDSRKYKYYAGPVKLYAENLCVKYSGTIADTRVDGEIASGGRGAWGNCG
ncbi:hypothetical protein AB0O28_26220 [Microbispora sp. NPDC088329]|uniref:hypothetical protein n=1 Tax=unclassified Microbispora TaxID=2614687 RepID=UPI0034199097